MIFERKLEDEKLLARCEKRGEESLGSRDKAAAAVLGWKKIDGVCGENSTVIPV